MKEHHTMGIEHGLIVEKSYQFTTYCNSTNQKLLFFLSKKLVLPSKKLRIYIYSLLEIGLPVLETNPIPSPF
jgi:hypothetical protein